MTKNADKTKKGTHSILRNQDTSLLEQKIVLKNEAELGEPKC